jgi:hydrogenase maturation protein HypF
VLAEKAINRPVIGIAFDGNGLGTDGNVWGGECLLVNGASFKRLAHIDYFQLPGGDTAVKEIWRIAVSLLVKYGYTGSLARVASREQTALITSMMENNINSPLTSSMGRLFDAAAALIGVRKEVSFEAQAAIEMESLAIDNPVRKGYNFDIVFKNDKMPAVISVKPVIEGILADLSKGLSKGLISSKFHFTAAEMIYGLAAKFGKAYRIKDIVLSGGVFQNRALTRLSIKRLTSAGFRPHINTIVPPNDGGVSLGQIWIANKTLLKDKIRCV